MKRLFGLLLLLALGLSFLKAQSFSAVMTIRYERVTFQRDNTPLEFRLRQGAQMPVGDGDTISTGEEGRVRLVFPFGEWLLLPSSVLKLETLRQEGEGWYLEASLESGVLVQKLRPDAEVSYRLQAGAMQVLSPATHFAMWHVGEISTLAVAEGAADVRVNSADAYTVEEAQALWTALGDTRHVKDLAFPLNNARVEAHLFGCVGVVQTIFDTGVLVRRGIGQRQERLGLIPNGTEVRVMAINQAGYWLRIQYLSAFSWIVEEAVQHDCDDQPRLPDNSPLERIMLLVNPNANEIDLLKPFYQTPFEDTFFYQYR
jgi:hypothetical protein